MRPVLTSLYLPKVLDDLLEEELELPDVEIERLLKVLECDFVCRHAQLDHEGHLVLVRIFIIDDFGFLCHFGNGWGRWLLCWDEVWLGSWLVVCWLVGSVWCQL